MRIHFHNSALLFLAILIYSCTPKPLDIELEAPKERLVIASQMLPRGGMVVSLTKSFSSLKKTKAGDGNYSEEFIRQIAVKNAVVTITYNNVTENLTPNDTIPGLYQNLSVQHLRYQTYVLKAYDPQTGESIEAHSTMLIPIKFDTIASYVKVENASQNFYIKYSIQDPGYIKNWYMVSYTKLVNGQRVALKRSRLPKNIPLKKTALNIQNPETEDFEIFTDLGATANVISAEKRLEGITPSDTVIVSLTNIEEGYYNFLDTKRRSGGIVTSFAGEPVNLNTNVVNGYGYFTTYFPTITLLSSSQVLDLSTFQ